MSEQKDTTFDSTNLLIFLLKWRKPLIIICTIAALSSAIVSFLIEEKYRSLVIMFPASTSSVSKALIAENMAGKHDILSFGEEEEAEQMLQMLNSDEIRGRICEKYNLMEHYEIEPDEQYAKTLLLEEYEDNITFRRTKFQSVEVKVLDKDPQIAADIANDISNLLDSVMNRMQKERAIKAFRIVESEYTELVNFMRIMEDSMTVLRRMGVNEYDVQIEMYTAEYSKALSAGNTKAIKALEEKMNVLSEHGSAYVSLKNSLEFQSERLSNLRMKFKEARVDATTEIPHKFVVNRAYPAEKKAYPIRWLIVVVSTFAAFLIGMLAIIALENYKKLKSDNTI